MIIQAHLCIIVALDVMLGSVFEKRSTPKFDVDVVRFVKKFGRLSFKIWNFWKSLARCHSKS
jgi:hypothetical protein